MTDQVTSQKQFVPNDSEQFRTVPNTSESFGTIPQDAESFRTLRNLAERKENHTLTVREVSRMFEAAGVARTERSIVNWCQPNRTGIARLDAYFDPNERRYYIAPQSVELAIAEEKAKAAKANEPSERFETITNDTANLGGAAKNPERPPESPPTPSAESTDRMKTLEQEVMDLKITNRAKDFFIEQLRNDRTAFAEERQTFVDKLITFTRKVGELETRLLQLGAPSAREATATIPKEIQSAELAKMETPSGPSDREGEGNNVCEFQK